MDYKLSEIGISFGRYGCDTHTAGANRHIHDKKKRVNTQGINIQNVTGKWQQKNGFPSGATRRNKKMANKRIKMNLKK